MKKRATMIRFLAAALSAGMLFTGSVQTEAAKKTSNTRAYEAVFDADYYYNTYPDLQAAFGHDAKKLFSHFVTYGVKEGRSGCAEFNLQVYKANYPDLQAAFGNQDASYCTHYINYGRSEGRNAVSLEEGAVIQTSGTEAAAQTEAAVQNQLASCTTYYDATVPRGSNIAVAVSRLNGVVVQPGEQFSFSKTILPRTRANGYVEAPIYLSGKHGKGIGGGICQVSSTLYSAMLDAGIPATERHPHSLPVTYLPEGRDATIAGNYYDLKFVNTLDRPILISASTNGGNGSVTVTLSTQ